jgi:hypothetical protein
VRIRALKPGFFKNEALAALSPWHRLAFAGVWCCADRDGRLEDRPKRLKAEIFPYDAEINMDELLTDLTADGFLRRYTVNNLALIDIPSWPKHQHPRQDEPPSLFPLAPVKKTDICADVCAVTDPHLHSGWEVGDRKWVVGSGIPAALPQVPPDPFRTITRFAHEALDALGAMAALSDVVDTVKQRCAQTQPPIPYDSGLVGRAVTTALHVRAKRSRA